jgi:hypothetical protein
MSDKVILDRKKSYWYILGDFFTYGQILLKIAKNHKKLKFSKRPNMTFYALK